MSKSHVEEMLASLALIAGLISWHIGWHVFAWLLFVKAAFDTGCSITFAFVELAKKKLP